MKAVFILISLLFLAIDNMGQSCYESISSIDSLYIQSDINKNKVGSIKYYLSDSAKLYADMWTLVLSKREFDKEGRLIEIFQRKSIGLNEDTGTQVEVITEEFQHILINRHEDRIQAICTFSVFENGNTEVNSIYNYWFDSLGHGLGYKRIIGQNNWYDSMSVVYNDGFGREENFFNDNTLQITSIYSDSMLCQFRYDVINDTSIIRSIACYNEVNSLYSIDFFEKPLPILKVYKRDSIGNLINTIYYEVTDTHEISIERLLEKSKQVGSVAQQKKEYYKNGALKFLWQDNYDNRGFKYLYEFAYKGDTTFTSKYDLLHTIGYGKNDTILVEQNVVYKGKKIKEDSFDGRIKYGRDVNNVSKKYRYHENGCIAMTRIEKEHGFVDEKWFDLVGALTYSHQIKMSGWGIKEWYNAFGKPTRYLRYTKEGTDTIEGIILYDTLQRIIKVTQSYNDSISGVITYTYNPQGFLISEINELHEYTQNTIFNDKGLAIYRVFKQDGALPLEEYWEYEYYE
jgi:hypothetical protein